MKRTIKSVYSDDNYSLDGIYIVDVPEEHESDYRNRIATVGKLVSELKIDVDVTVDADESLDELAENYPDEKEFIESRRQQFEESVDEGCGLTTILGILGWEYERVVVDDEYDADYDEFI